MVRNNRPKPGAGEPPGYSASWIATRTIFEARNLHRRGRRTDFVNHLVRLRDEGVLVEHAVEAGVATRKVSLLGDVLEVFAAGLRSTELVEEPEIERMDDPLQAALLLVRSDLGLDRVLTPFARLAFTDPAGSLMDAIVRREAEGSLRLEADVFHPYLVGAAPRPLKTWITSRSAAGRGDALHFALWWADYRLTEVALAAGATAHGWPPAMIEELQKRSKRQGAILARRAFDAERGKGAAAALVELALGTSSGIGAIAAARRYPDIDRVLGLDCGDGPGARDRA